MRATQRICSFACFAAVGLFLLACGKDESVQLNTSPADTSETDDGTDDTDDGPTPGAGGSIGRPGTMPTPTVPTPTGNSPIGRPCIQDGDCADGLRCLTSDSDEWLGGGPGNGYCTADCIDDALTCPAIDANAFCLQSSDTEAVCVQGCITGSLGAKCQGRGDVACDSIILEGEGFCRPMCRNDDDCDGRKCDLGLGACVDDLPVGDPIGTECDPDAQVSTCQSGICLPMGEEYAVCIGLCTVGQTGCGSEDGIPENPGAPFCLFPLASGGPGDLGICNQRCNCDDDCLHPDSLCLIAPEDFAGVLGTAGVCVESSYPDDDPEFTLGRACEPGSGDDAGPSTGADSGPSPEPDAAPPTPVEEAGPAAPVDASSDAASRDQ